MVSKRRSSTQIDRDLLFPTTSSQTWKTAYVATTVWEGNQSVINEYTRQIHMLQSLDETDHNRLVYVLRGIYQYMIILLSVPFRGAFILKRTGTTWSSQRSVEEEDDSRHRWFFSADKRDVDDCY